MALLKTKNQGILAFRTVKKLEMEKPLLKNALYKILLYLYTLQNLATSVIVKGAHCQRFLVIFVLFTYYYDEVRQSLHKSAICPM